MDFNEIKNIWNDSFKAREQLSSEQIEAMLRLKNRSNTALTKLRRSFRIELIFGGIMYLIIIAGIVFLIDIPESLVFLVLTTLLMGVSYMYYLKTFQKIRTTVYIENTLKQSLEKTLEDVERFVWFGKNNALKFIMIPMATILGMAMGLYVVHDGNIIDILLSLPEKSLIKMISLLVISVVVLVPLSRYQFDRRFKKHVEELKNCLKEFEDTQNN